MNVKHCIFLYQGTIKFSKNGKDLGHAFDIPGHVRKEPIFAACVLKNAEIQFNFGDEPFKHPPSDGFQPLCKAPANCCVNSTATGSKSTAVSDEISFKYDIRDIIRIV